MVTGSIYGFNTKIDKTSLMNPPDGSYPTISVARTAGETDETVTRFDDQMAVMGLLGGGIMVFERKDLKVTFTRETPITDDQLVHPYMSLVAITHARWAGRESFHCGAFVVGGRAFGLLGAKEMGKSTLLAGLAVAGIPIVTDDVLVIEDRRCFRGPRCLDLRPGAAEAVGVEAVSDPGREPPRDRMALGPCEESLELAGWIDLAWGDLGIAEIHPFDRPGVLAPNAGWLLPPPDASVLLDLASLPMMRLTRPKRWQSHPQTQDMLLQAVQGF